MSATGVVPRILHAELSEYRRQLRDARADAEKLVDGLTDTQFNWRPAPGRWSIAECLDHLNNGWRVLPKLDHKIAAAAEQGLRGEGPYTHPFLGRLYVRFVEPPRRSASARRRRTFRPPTSRSPPSHPASSSCRTRSSGA